MDDMEAQPVAEVDEETRLRRRAEIERIAERSLVDWGPVYTALAKT